MKRFGVIGTASFLALVVLISVIMLMMVDKALTLDQGITPTQGEKNGYRITGKFGAKVNLTESSTPNNVNNVISYDKVTSIELFNDWVIICLEGTETDTDDAKTERVFQYRRITPKDKIVHIITKDEVRK